MSLSDVIQLILVGMLFPFAGYFFKKNERMHEETQKAQGAQDIKIAILEVEVNMIKLQLGMQNNGANTTNITL